MYQPLTTSLKLRHRVIFVPDTDTTHTTAPLELSGTFPIYASNTVPTTPEHPPFKRAGTSVTSANSVHTTPLPLLLVSVRERV